MSAGLASGGTNDASLAEADPRLQGIVDRARALFEAARRDNFPEIAQDADVLKQRMTALCKRLASRS